MRMGKQKVVVLVTVVKFATFLSTAGKQAID